jgi:D-alanine-D-alanine ligase
VTYKVAVIYNEPMSVRYRALGEERAILNIREDAKAVAQALGELGHSVEEVPLRPPFSQAADTLRGLAADVIFNLFEGFEDHPETEPTMARILDELGLPYTGCRADALALALDKGRSKALMEEKGIATPRYQLLSPETLVTFSLDFPCIVKPRREDASHGLSENSVVRDDASLQERVTWVSSHFGGMALVEEFLEGREFNGTLLSNGQTTALPISEIVYSLPDDMPRVLTYAAKWDTKSVYYQNTNPVCPAETGPEDQARIVDIMTAVFRLMVGDGYARVDMRMDNRGEVNVLEVNPNPDISPISGAARQARAAGMSYSQFMGEILSLAFQRQKR